MEPMVTETLTVKTVKPVTVYKYVWIIVEAMTIDPEEFTPL